MDWVEKRQNYKDLYGILQLLRGSHLKNFPLKTLKLGWVVFIQKCLDFQSNQYKKLAPVLSRFCNGLFWGVVNQQLGNQQPYKEENQFCARNWKAKRKNVFKMSGP